MFAIKKFVTPFLVPPGILVLMFFVLAFLKRRSKAQSALFLFLAILLWALSIEPTSHFLMKSIEMPFKTEDALSGDVIVVLGGGLKEGVSDLTGQGAPASEALVRLVYAYRLWKRFNLPIIVSGGEVFMGKGAEALVLKRFLQDMGVPEELIIVEQKSRDTHENLKFVKEICDLRGFRRPIVVTSAYHMKRTLIISKKFSMDVIPFPCGHKTWEGRRFIWYEYLPSGGAMKDINLASKELLGLIFYLLS